VWTSVLTPLILRAAYGSYVGRPEAGAVAGCVGGLLAVDAVEGAENAGSKPLMRRVKKPLSRGRRRLVAVAVAVIDVSGLDALRLSLPLTLAVALGAAVVIRVLLGVSYRGSGA
jgi:hypothetical protein